MLPQLARPQIEALHLHVESGNERIAKQRNYVFKLPSVVVARVSLDFYHLRFRERWKPRKPRHIKEIHRLVADSGKVFGNLNT